MTRMKGDPIILNPAAGTAEGITEVLRQEATLLRTEAERMLGYTAAEVMNKITPADISDPQELIARAKSLSVNFTDPEQAEASINLVLSEKKVTNYELTARDVTERNQLERVL